MAAVSFFFEICCHKIKFEKLAAEEVADERQEHHDCADKAADLFEHVEDIERVDHNRLLCAGHSNCEGK